MELVPTLLVFIAILVAAIVSVEANISVAIVALLAGFLVTNILGFQNIPLIESLANLGSLFLIFLAGAEVNTEFLRMHYRSSLELGFTAFLLPFVAVLVAGFVIVPSWGLRPLLVTAIAFSEVSVAIVFTILRERAIANTTLGRTILAATFVTNFLVMVSLSVLFVNFRIEDVLYFGILLVAFLFLPRIGTRLVSRYEDKTVEVEVRYILTIILVGALLAQYSQIQAAVVVFALGLSFSDVLTDSVQTRLDAVGFGLLIPVFFFQVGLNIQSHVLLEDADQIVLLLVVISIARRVGTHVVFQRLLPAATQFGTALMNARLTFATVVATFSLTTGTLSRSQFSVIVATVFLSAVAASLELRYRSTLVTEDEEST